MVQPILTCPNPTEWLDRIARYVAPEGECWRWLQKLNDEGYGRFSFTGPDGRRHQTGAHRAAWLAYVGDIPDPRLEVDHLCRNRACVNPWHMDLVTGRVNSLRGLPGGGKKGRSGRKLGTPPGCRKHGLEDGYRITLRNGYEPWICRPCRREVVARMAAKRSALT